MSLQNFENIFFENSEFGMRSKIFLPSRKMNRMNRIRRSASHKNVCWATEWTELDFTMVRTINGKLLISYSPETILF